MKPHQSELEKFFCLFETEQQQQQKKKKKHLLLLKGFESALILLRGKKSVFACFYVFKLNSRRVSWSKMSPV